MTEKQAFSVVRDHCDDVSHIIWDVDGPIVFRDKPDFDVLRFIAKLAKAEIFQSFISGRDASWLVKNLINPLKEVFPGFHQYTRYFSVYPELGTITFDLLSGERIINPSLENHPLTRFDIRTALSMLALKTFMLGKYQPGTKIRSNCRIGGDAEGNLYLIPKETNVLLPFLIWSSTKSVIGTYEVLRDEHGDVPNLEMGEIVKVIMAKIKELGLEGKVSIAPTRTAIDIAPIVNSNALNKDVAGGLAISQVREKTTSDYSLIDITGRTIAFGDGKTDFLFTLPIQQKNPGENSRPNRIMMCFVGPVAQYELQYEKVGLVWLKGDGAIVAGGKIGPEVTLEMLEYIWQKGCFRSLEPSPGRIPEK